MEWFFSRAEGKEIEETIDEGVRENREHKGRWNNRARY